MKRIILMMVAVFVVTSATVNAQVSRLSIDTVPTIKRVVRVNTFMGKRNKSFCVPVLHIDKKIFIGSKTELISLTSDNTGPNVASDSHIVIRQGIITSIYEKQKAGHWEQLTSTHEVVSGVRIATDGIFVKLKKLPVQDYKLNPVTNENFLKNVPRIPHWDLISYW